MTPGPTTTEAQPMSLSLTDLAQATQRGDLVPYLGPGVLADVTDADNGDEHRSQCSKTHNIRSIYIHNDTLPHDFPHGGQEKAGGQSPEESEIG